jgi:hypothetical protein
LQTSNKADSIRVQSSHAYILLSLGCRSNGFGTVKSFLSGMHVLVEIVIFVIPVKRTRHHLVRRSVACRCGQVLGHEHSLHDIPNSVQFDASSRGGHGRSFSEDQKEVNSSAKYSPLRPASQFRYLVSGQFQPLRAECLVYMKPSRHGDSFLNNRLLARSFVSYSDRGAFAWRQFRMMYVFERVTSMSPRAYAASERR